MKKFRRAGRCLLDSPKTYQEGHLPAKVCGTAEELTPPQEPDLSRDHPEYLGVRDRFKSGVAVVPEEVKRSCTSSSSLCPADYSLPLSRLKGFEWYEENVSPYRLPSGVFR